MLSQIRPGEHFVSQPPPILKKNNAGIGFLQLSMFYNVFKTIFGYRGDLKCKSLVVLLAQKHKRDVITSLGI